MTDYSELVKALRHCSDHLGCTECPRYDAEKARKYFGCGALEDAAAAIEALQAVAHSHCVAASAYWEELEELKQQLPKRGEWIDRYDEDDKPFFKRKYVCSACDHWNTYGKSKYCPKCGAKMEVQDG